MSLVSPFFTFSQEKKCRVTCFTLISPKKRKRSVNQELLHFYKPTTPGRSTKKCRIDGFALIPPGKEGKSVKQGGITLLSADNSRPGH